MIVSDKEWQELTDKCKTLIALSADVKQERDALRAEVERLRDVIEIAITDLANGHDVLDDLRAGLSGEGGRDGD